MPPGSVMRFSKPKAEKRPGTQLVVPVHGSLIKICKNFWSGVSSAEGKELCAEPNNESNRYPNLFMGDYRLPRGRIFGDFLELCYLRVT